MMGQRRQSQNTDQAKGLDITQHITGNHWRDREAIKQVFIKHHADWHLRKGLSGGQEWKQEERTSGEGVH